MANEFKVLVYMTTIIGTGVALMKYTVPNEDEIVKVPWPEYSFSLKEKKIYIYILLV